MHDDPVRKLKILIVEDQAPVREVLRIILGELGVAQVFEAVDGQEAHDFMRDANDMVDLVICDWNLPHMTGLDLFEQVRARGHSMPFLMVTGRTDASSILQAHEKGIQAYIRKPFTSEELEVQIRIALAKI